MPPLVYLLLALLALVLGTSQGASPPLPLPSPESATTSADGLELTLRMAKVGEGDPGEVFCELHNTTTAAIGYDQTGRSFGLSIRLLDRNANLLTMNADWEKMHSPDAPFASEGRHSFEKIEPGASLTFSIRLAEAYGDAWKQGMRLEGSWSPGFDGSGAQLTKGRGLKATLYLSRAAGQNGPSVNPPAEAPLSVTPQAGQKGQSSTSRPPPLKAPVVQIEVPRTSAAEKSFWPLWAAAAAGLGGFVWWRTRKRRNDEE